MYINSEGKADDAMRFVEDVKNQYGNGTCTLCTIYNATGNNLTFERSHSWTGTVWQSPYPHILANGALFFTSVAPSPVLLKRVLCIQARTMLACPVLGCSLGTHLAWIIRIVFTEILTPALSSAINWNAVDNRMERQLTNLVIDLFGGFSSLAVGAGPSPNLIGIMSLEGVNRNVTVLLANDVISAIVSSLDEEGVEGGDDSNDDATPATAE
ncbi:hypothetical protein CASFOL_022277 [Castilleja foliolosa]|uniref:Uncharacterized protein n=1 Tax=Castilleja foliolosa TaxID=1961234 RepID=A0ABD3CU68_9LAMI